MLFNLMCLSQMITSFQVSYKVTQHKVLEKIGLNYLLNRKLTFSNETRKMK